jgi:hypothetical protein
MLTDNGVVLVGFGLGELNSSDSQKKKENGGFGGIQPNDFNSSNKTHQFRCQCS